MKNNLFFVYTQREKATNHVMYIITQVSQLINSANNQNKLFCIIFVDSYVAVYLQIVPLTLQTYASFTVVALHLQKLYFTLQLTLSQKNNDTQKKNVVKTKRIM